MTAYYNEFDPYAAQWLRNLIAAGHIAPGVVDERSIADVRPEELRDFTQCHFFAGIGVWSYALRRAGWADDRPVWTGSCPCQPFSAAGKGGGFDDERHLWPHFHWLISQCRPAIVLGEQVASKDGLAWLDLVQADLEGTGYAAGAVDLCAAGVGAPHIRQRLWWVGERLADAELPPEQRQQPLGGAALREQAANRSTRSSVAIGLDGNASHAGLLQGQEAASVVGLEHAPSDGRIERWAEPSGRSIAGGCGDSGMADTDEAGQRVERGVRLQRPELHDVDGRREDGGLADTDGRQRYGFAELRGAVGDGQDAGRPQGGGEPGARRDDDRPGPTNGLWRDADWLFCRDGKWRPVESGTFPLAHGAPARVGRLRGYGNAINAEAAVAFISCLDR